MKHETTWREERKSRCEFYRSGNQCYLRNMELCEYYGVKGNCGFYVSEMYNPDTLPILKTDERRLVK